MSDLLRRVFSPAPPAVPDPSLAEQIARLSELTAALDQHVTRLSKEQFKANTLAENALADAREAINTVSAARAALERFGTDRPSQLKPPSGSASPPRLIESLMPILDGIEAGLESGETALARLADPGAREILAGWLIGQRLLRDRLLAVFDKEGVRPIPALGHAFDPYRHVAVETVRDSAGAPGTILSERRRGYETDERVLRFADVVVSAAPDDLS